MDVAEICVLVLSAIPIIGLLMLGFWHINKDCDEYERVIERYRTENDRLRETIAFLRSERR
jgi:FtsZ-interacting cell division protein ZipA